MSYKNWQEVIGGRAGLIIIGSLIVLTLLIILTDLLNLPSLLSGTSLLQVHWIDMIIDIIIAFTIGLIAITLIRQSEAKRRETEHTLRKSEGKYRELAESISDVFFVMDRDLRYTYWNKASEKLTGISMQDAIGKSLYELFPDMKGTKAEEMYLEVWRAQQPKSMVNMYQIGGKDFFFELSAYPSKEGLSVFVKDITERKKAEEALRHSEGDYRGLFEGAHDAIIIFDPEGEIILDANQRASDIYGFDRSEFIGMSLEKITKDIPQGKRQIQATLDKGCYHNFETVQYCRDGTGMLLDVNASMVDYRGKRAILSINRDITERKRAEEALRESEEKYRALIEASGRAGEGIIIIQDSGEGEAVFVFVNDRFCRMSGYSVDELLGRSPWDLIPHEISVRLKDWYKRRHMGEFLPSYYEAAGIHKDGTIVPLELSIVTMPWQGKIATVLYLRDITERKQAEEALIKSEEKYRFLYENSPVVNLMIGIDGIIIDINEAGVKTLGYSKDEIVGKPALEFVVPEQRGKVAAELERDFRGEYTPEIDVDIIAKEGSIHTILFSRGHVTLHEKGQPTGILVNGIDITERKQMEEALRESEERFRQLAENIDQVFWLTDWENNKLLYVNPSYQKLFGRSCQSAYKDRLSWYKVIHPDDRAPVRELLVKNAKLGQSTEVEYRIVRDDGAMRWILDRNYPIRDKHGKVYRIVSVAEDITERKKAEEELTSLLRFQNEMLDTAAIWIDTLDAEGNVTFWNRAAERISGYSKEDVLGHSKIWEWLYPDLEYRTSIFAKAMNIIQKGERVENFETTIRCKEGEFRVISWHSNNLMDETGKIVGSIALGADITERKRAEEALRTERDRIETVTQNIGVGLAIVSKEYRTLWSNEVLKKIFGDDEGKTCYQTYNLRSDICPGCGVREVFEKGKDICVHEQVGKDKNGETIWSQIIATAIKDKEGNITAALEVVVPITERKRAEEQIAYQAQLLAIVNDAVVASDAQYRLTAWNAASESMYGWKAEEVIGRFGLDITRTEFPGVDKAEMLRAIAERGSWRGEATQARKDGTRFPVEVSSVVLRDATGKVTAFVSVNRDITERKKMEEEITSLAKFPSENPNPILRLNQNGVIVYANSASQQLLEEWECDVRGCAPSFWRDLVTDAFKSNSKKTVDVECGEKVYSFLIVPITDAGYVNLYGRDITERKKAEEEIRKKNEELEAFVYMVSHDLKNPVVSIQGFCSSILKNQRDELNEKTLFYLQRVQANASLMSSLLDDLVELSRIGRIEDKKTEISVQEVIKSVWAGVSTSLATQDVEFVCPKNLPQVVYPEKRLYQIFSNLVSNAVKFKSENKIPQVEIGYQENKGNYTFFVRDNGIGIEQKYHNKIFESFSQLKDTKSEGTGMGLAIVKKIVEANLGKAWVESQKGAGSTFYFTIPKNV